jgi:hypothetical protein
MWRISLLFRQRSLVVNINPLFLYDLVHDLLVNIDPDLLSILTQTFYQYWPRPSSNIDPVAFMNKIWSAILTSWLYFMIWIWLTILTQLPLRLGPSWQYWPEHSWKYWPGSGWRFWPSCLYGQDLDFKLKPVASIIIRTQSAIMINDQVAWQGHDWQFWHSCLYEQDLDVKPEPVACLYNNQDPVGDNDPIAWSGPGWQIVHSSLFDQDLDCNIDSSCQYEHDLVDNIDPVASVLRACWQYWPSCFCCQDLVASVSSPLPTRINRSNSVRSAEILG